MTNAIQIAGLIPKFELSDRMRKAREVAGLTQDELSERSGVGRATIARIEYGKGTPRRASLIALAFATGVDLHWLETGETPAGNSPDGGSECAIRDSNPEPTD
ncbi:helix-turn-helix domain-containing protein [Corynebacterium poyangense]|uniref:Helix-turn-helix domain-containing protein n=2 Tax=Corynebacterium poyangense TaxID=2684405 RepID=A0A7H0SSH6_9CORY|nr:helix-turn-helix domain-containing protein [Corynebacterium poyangense]